MLSIDVSIPRILGAVATAGLPALALWALAQELDASLLSIVAAWLALTASILFSRILDGVKIDLEGTRFERTAAALSEGRLARLLTRSFALRLSVAATVALAVALLEAPLHTALTGFGWGEPVTGIVSLALLLFPTWVALHAATRASSHRRPSFFAAVGASFVEDLGHRIQTAGRWEAALIFGVVNTTLAVVGRAFILAAVPWLAARPLLLVAVAAVGALTLLFAPEILVAVRKKIAEVEDAEGSNNE